MSANDFKLIKLQFVFFTPNFYVSNKSELSAKLKRNYPDVNEIILPLPADVPPEIPFIILNKQDQVEIKVARGRIDFSFFDLRNEDTNFINNEFANRVNQIFDTLKTAPEFAISDVGFIIESLKEQGENDRYNEANNVIKPLFAESVQDSLIAFEREAETSLRNLKKKRITFTDNEILINEIFQLNTAPKKNNQRINSLFVQFDRNTFPHEGEKTFNWDNISSFISSEHTAYVAFINQLIEKLSLTNAHNE